MTLLTLLLVLAGNPNEVEIPRVEGSQIVLDGVLDDAVWQQATLLTGFMQYQPVDGRPAMDSTHVYVWYEATAIHFGIRAYEVHSEVRATLADRDKIDGDDHVLLVLDTYNDRRQAVGIAVNPLGQQADGILRDAQQGGFFRGGGQPFNMDLSPDFVFQSAGRETDFGYEVEITVPFKSLRFQPSVTQTWGFNVVRNVAHSGYSTAWTEVRQNNASFLGQSGQLSDLTDLRRGIVLDVSPEITGSLTRAAGDSPWDGNARDPLGVNVRWGVTNNLTLNGTVNPDFSQVEADVAQIQTDPRRALFFPEKRPFFLDGIEQFQGPTNLIYTRRIANPLTAVKLTGKTGATNVGVLSAVDNTELYLGDLEARYFNAVRLSRDLSGQNTIGGTYTDKIDGDRWNRVGAVDGRLVSGIYSATWQVAGSLTGDGSETVGAPMWTWQSSATGRKYAASFSTTGFHPDFNAESGFLQRIGIATATFSPRRTWYGQEGALVERFTFGLTFDGTWDYDRFTRGTGPNDRKLHFNTAYSFRGGWSGGTSVFYESFKYPEELYTGYFVAPASPGGQPTPYVGVDRLINLGFWSTLGTPQWKKFSGFVFLVGGRDDNFFEWASADIFFVNGSLNWNPTDQIRVNLLYNHQQFIRVTDRSNVGLRRVPRLKVEYQATPSLFVRVVGQYDSNFVDELRDDSRTNRPIVVRNSDGTFSGIPERRSNFFRFDWLFSYRPTPGTVVFLGYGSSLTEPQTYRFSDFTRLNDGFFLKLSYRYRV
ncbi:MAG: hypothetical protein JJ896_07325 [Rhodothermales bacterium]|nr:hypothetical protein [Rhodothermales bacterium]MBO6779449.1 hypothetical protein [Rhodothermales bacterium]